jgi:hypothetical protein
VGFTLPDELLRPRCALTAPFHPCRYRAVTRQRRYLFCGTFRKSPFERLSPAVSRHAALRRPDFPPEPAAKRRIIKNRPERPSVPTRQLRFSHAADPPAVNTRAECPSCSPGCRVSKDDGTSDPCRCKCPRCSPRHTSEFSPGIHGPRRPSQGKTVGAGNQCCATSIAHCGMRCSFPALVAVPSGSFGARNNVLQSLRRPRPGHGVGGGWPASCISSSPRLPGGGQV